VQKKIGDLTVYYERHGQGAPLLLIHGLGSSTRDWENQVKALSSFYEVIVFDLRGHGKTDKPKGPYKVSLFAKDTAQLIQSLFSKPIDVVGHSLGGMIAFQLALDFPSLVNRLVIINSGPAVIFPNLKTRFYFYLRRLSVKWFGMKKLSQQLAKALFPKPEQDELREIFIARWEENDPRAYLDSLKAFLGWNVIPRLGSIKCPTLIIAADHDYTPVAFKEYYTKLIPGAILKVIPDSYHITLIDKPNELNQVLLDFLGGGYAIEK